MSTKSHTKNELARISAKIQQLKKKYPTSSELYAPTDKQNVLSKASVHDESQQFNSNFHPIPRNSLKQRPSNHNSRNSPKEDSKQNTDRSSKQQQSFIHTEFNPNGRFYEERKYHQSCNKKSAYNKENMSPFTQELNHQKPFKEYKEELKNLKKQILSSLDFQNFQLSKQKTQNTPKIVSNTFETFSKNQPLNPINNSFVLTQTKPKQVQTKEKETPLQALEKNKNLVIRIVDESQNSMVTEEPKSINQGIHQHESVKNYESHLSLEYLNEILQKLHEDFHSHKQQVSQKFQQLDSQSECYSKQNAQINFKLQNIEKQFKNKQLSKGTQFDIKIVEIQNQSIGKLSKQLHKEIELINAQINSIKNQICDHQKLSLESESIEFSKQIMDSFAYNLKEQIMEQVELINQKYETELKDFEGKFFRQIFDMKNEIELMGEKIKKEDYFEKNLKSLVPQTSQNNQIKPEELSKQIKNELLSDKSFIQRLGSQIQHNISEKVSHRFFDQVNGVRSQVSEQISKEISTVNKTFKEIETKMVSYGILIQNLEQSLKQLSNSQNDDQLQIELISKIKQAVLSEIGSQLGSKQFTLKESILKQRDSKGFLRAQNIPGTNQQIESQSAQVQIHPIVNQQNYRSNGASQVSIFTTQEGNLAGQEGNFTAQEGNSGSSQIWLTSVEKQSGKKMFSSQVRYYERPSYGRSEKGQSFLLDQLVKNSLVFSALNN